MILSFVDIVFTEFIRDPRQVKISDVYQVDAVLCPLALCPFIAPEADATVRENSGRN